MVTQTPGENTGSRTRRPHYKDRFVYSILHFDITVSRAVLRASSSDFLVQPSFSQCQISRSFPISKDWETVLWHILEGDHKNFSPVPVSANSRLSISRAWRFSRTLNIRFGHGTGSGFTRICARWRIRSSTTNVRAFSFFRGRSAGLLEPRPIDSENSIFRRIGFDERVIFFVQMGDQFPIEKIRRDTHRCLVMTIKAKNIWQKDYSQISLRDSQP